MTEAHINKTMDRDDLLRPECQAVLAELFGLIRRMRSRGAKYSSWYGRTDAWPSAWEHINRGEDYEPWPGNPDELAVPWFLLWQIAWLVANTPLKPGSRVLDMGGAGSLFSCYLASRGHDVYAIDLEEGLCRLASDTAARMNWRLTARRMDMTELTFSDEFFDHIFSVCVFEHLPVSGRVACNEQVARVLRRGGMAGYTFDYDNPQSFGRLDSSAGVHSQLIAPSGLTLRGTGGFRDSGKRYLQAPPCFGYGRFMKLVARMHAGLRGTIERGRALTGRTSYTIGAIFLEKATFAT